MRAFFVIPQICAFRLHYIPLSTSYTEIYNIHAFFSGGTPDALVVVNSTAQHASRSQRIPLEGDKRLRRIARAGKNWQNTIGRRVDMEGELGAQFEFLSR